MATKFDKFLPLVRPDVAGCPEFTILEHVRLAARDFCEATLIWKDFIDPFKTKSNQAVYQVDAPAEAHRYEKLYCDGKELQQLNVRDLPEDWMGRVDKPYGYLIFNAGEVQLYPTPSAAYDITGVAWLTPDTEIPDWMFARHREAIAFGAKHRLMEIIGKEWSNPAGAAFNSGKFAEAKLKLAGQKYHGTVLTVRAAEY